MYMRLAFAVAAHLETEILLVDEVLAVGDIQFQQKCLGKMQNVSKEGRTVLFVTHNMAAINKLCNKGILLNNGEVEKYGDVNHVTNFYLMSNQQSNASVNLESYSFHKGNGSFRFKNASILNKNGETCQFFSIGDDVSISFEVEKFQNIKRPKIAVELRTADGIPLCNMVDIDSGFHLISPKNIENITVTLKDIRLYPGSYYISLWIGSVNSADIFDYVKDCLAFNIVDGGKLAARRLPKEAGLFFFTPEWRKMIG